jgi:hypothetical protein
MTTRFVYGIRRARVLEVASNVPGAVIAHVATGSGLRRAIPVPAVAKEVVRSSADDPVPVSTKPEVTAPKAPSNVPKRPRKHR